MNRAQQRSSARRAPVTSNGKSPSPSGTGIVRQPLKEPEQVGSISVAEAAEIRERRRLREKYEADMKVKQDEIQDIAKVLTILRLENESYLQKLLRERGLKMDDDYNVQSDTGVIWRTAVSVEPVSEIETDAEPMPSPAAILDAKGSPERET